MCAVDGSSISAAGDGASTKDAQPEQSVQRAPGSPKSLSGDHPRSLCSDGAAGSGRDCSSQRKKRRHPVARVKGNWLPDEDDRLRQLVKTEGEGQWSVIAKSFPGRIGKQCRERWHNQLRPDIKREAWTDEEEMILIAFHLKLGNKWADIAKELVGRTENAVKNHWNATLRRRDSDQGGATKLKEYMRSLNILPQKRKRKPSDGIPRSPRSPRSPDGLLPGGRKRAASAGETPCSYVKRPALWAEHLMGPGSSGQEQEEDIPLYDYAFSAASCGPPPKGTPTDVLMPTASSTRRQLQPMMPAQGSTISDTTHFTGGQVLLPSVHAPNLGCPEHLGDMEMMQQVTPPPKRPPLPRLDIPGAPSGAHLPASAAHNAMLTPRGRVDGLGWVKHDEDENLENALNALTYPEVHNGIVHRQDPTAASPALFSSIGASLGISPFQAALLNFTPSNHHTPRSHDGWNARTPVAFVGPPAALNVPAQWALQDVSSASVRPPRTDQVVDPAVCSMGPAIAPFSPDADAVVKNFISSPPPLMPGLSHDVDLLGSCPDPMELSGEPDDFSAIPAASSRNVNIFGPEVEADLLGGPCACAAAGAIGLTLDMPQGGDPAMCGGAPARLAPVWEGEQVAESPYQRFMQDFAQEGVCPEQADALPSPRAANFERTSSDTSASALVPADIQNMIRSMWSCEAPCKEDPPPGTPVCEISPGRGLGIVSAALPGNALGDGTRADKRSKAGAMKVAHANGASAPGRQLRSHAKTTYPSA